MRKRDRLLRFFYFLFSFFTKIYFRFGNLQEYIPAAPLPGGRDLAARQRGGRGISEKKFADKIVRRSLGASRPAAGAAGLGSRTTGCKAGTSKYGRADHRPK